MESLPLRLFERLSYQALEYFKEIEGMSLLITLKGIVETKWGNTQEVSILEVMMYRMIIDTISMNLISWQEGPLQNHNHFMLSLEKCSKFCIEIIMIIICFLHHQITEDSQFYPPDSFVQHGF